MPPTLKSLLQHAASARAPSAFAYFQGGGDRVPVLLVDKRRIDPNLLMEERKRATKKTPVTGRITHDASGRLLFQADVPDHPTFARDLKKTFSSEYPALKDAQVVPLPPKDPPEREHSRAASSAQLFAPDLDEDADEYEALTRRATVLGAAAGGAERRAAGADRVRDETFGRASTLHAKGQELSHQAALVEAGASPADARRRGAAEAKGALGRRQSTLADQHATLVAAAREREEAFLALMEDEAPGDITHAFEARKEALAAIVVAAEGDRALALKLLERWPSLVDRQERLRDQVEGDLEKSLEKMPGGMSIMVEREGARQAVDTAMAEVFRAERRVDHYAAEISAQLDALLAVAEDSPAWEKAMARVTKARRKHEGARATLAAASGVLPELQRAAREAEEQVDYYISHTPDLAKQKQLLVEIDQQLAEAVERLDTARVDLRRADEVLERSKDEGHLIEVRRAAELWLSDASAILQKGKGLDLYGVGSAEQAAGIKDAQSLGESFLTAVAGLQRHHLQLVEAGASPALVQSIFSTVPPRLLPASLIAEVRAFEDIEALLSDEADKVAAAKAEAKKAAADVLTLATGALEDALLVASLTVSAAHLVAVLPDSGSTALVADLLRSASKTSGEVARRDRGPLWAQGVSPDEDPVLARYMEQERVRQLGRLGKVLSTATGAVLEAFNPVAATILGAKGTFEQLRATAERYASLEDDKALWVAAKKEGHSLAGSFSQSVDHHQRVAIEEAAKALLTMLDTIGRGSEVVGLAVPPALVLGKAAELSAKVGKAITQVAVKAEEWGRAAEVDRLIAKAREGDAMARIELFRKSGRHAKALVALKATQGDAFALAYVADRSLKEDDITSSSFSIIRHYLLAVDQDDDEPETVARTKARLKKKAKKKLAVLSPLVEGLSKALSASFASPVPPDQLIPPEYLDDQVMAENVDHLLEVLEHQRQALETATGEEAEELVDDLDLVSENLKDVMNELLEGLGPLGALQRSLDDHLSDSDRLNKSIAVARDQLGTMCRERAEAARRIQVALR